MSFYHMLRPIHSSDRQIDHVKVVLPSFLPPPAVSDIPLQQLCKRVAENIDSSPIILVQTAFSSRTIYLLIAV